MMFIDRLFRPFEQLLDPLNLPITQLPDKGPFHLAWHFAKMFKVVLCGMTILSLTSALISVGIVWMLAYVVDSVSAQGAKAFVDNDLLLLCGFVVVLLVVGPLISFLEQSFSFQSVSTLMPAAMRWQAHKSVEEQDVAFFEDVYAGQVASRISQVTSSVNQQLRLAIEQIPFFAVQFIGSLSLLFVLSWQLAVPVLVWGALHIWLAITATPVLIKRSELVAEVSSRSTGAMTDVYSNISIVKAFGAMDSEADTIKQILQETIDTRHSEQRVMILTYTAVHFVNALLVVSLFVIGIWGLVAEFVTLGDFVAAATIARLLTNAAFMFIGLGFSLSETYGTLRDAMPLIASRPTITDKAGAPRYVPDGGTVEFDNVSYYYLSNVASDEISQAKSEKRESKESGRVHNEDDIADLGDQNDESAKPVLRNLSLTLQAGEKVGLVGLSGAGKSTMVSLLLRLREVTEGAIRIDGQDIRDVQQQSLRENMGVIAQDIRLMNRSVRENVKYGSKQATDDEIRYALKMAQALEFVEELRDKKGRAGLDAHVGNQGVKLSGGQRQRLAIARVILKDADILLLDEATSALDSEAEHAIQKNLETLLVNKTALVVAHRLSTIAAMDRLVVLDKGRIVEQGVHAELVATDGLYARLWKRQSGGFLAAG